MAKIRNKSKKLLLTGILAGAFAIINLGVIGYAFTIGNEKVTTDSFTINGFDYVSLTEAKSKDGKTLSSLTPIDYNGFYTLNNGEKVYTDTPTIQVVYDIEYDLSVDPDCFLSSYFFFTVEQTTGDAHEFVPDSKDHWTDLNLIDLIQYEEHESTFAYKYDDGRMQSAGTVQPLYAKNTDSSRFAMIIAGNRLNITSYEKDGIEQYKATGQITINYVLDFTSVINGDFYENVYRQMYEQNINFKVGVNLYDEDFNQIA